MNTLKWINPFTGKKEDISIDRNLVCSDGKLRIPEVLSVDLQDAFLLALDGCVDAAHEGKAIAMKHLMFYLLRQLKDDGKYSSRKFDLKTLTKSLNQENLSFKNYLAKTHEAIKEKRAVSDPYITYCQQIANVIFDPTHEKGLPRKGQLELTSDDFDVIYAKIAEAYSGTLGVEKNEAAKLRNFRARLKAKDCLGKRFEKLRDEATIYESFFHHAVAKSFLDVAIKNKMYSQLGVEIYTFLHLEQDFPNGVKSPLKYIPPLASLQIYPVICKTYEVVFKTTLQQDLANSIHKKIKGDSSAFETFLLNISGIINWYLGDYLNHVRSLDRKKLKAIPRISNDEVRVKKRSEALKGSFSKQITPKEILERYGSLTLKQKECYDLYMEGKGYDEIAKILEISKDSARDRLKGARKKLKG